jgi:hypothetical protein
MTTLGDAAPEQKACSEQKANFVFREVALVGSGTSHERRWQTVQPAAIYTAWENGKFTLLICAEHCAR